MKEMQKDIENEAATTRELEIGFARGALTSKAWRNVIATWGVIQDALTTDTPGWWVHDSLTIAEYNQLSDEQKKRRKSIEMGGSNALLGGSLNLEPGQTGPRKNQTLATRSLFTIDAEHMSLKQSQDLLEHVERTGLSAAVYTTYSSRPEAPRLRIVIPLTHPIDLVQYEQMAYAFCKNLAGDELMPCIDRCTWTPVQAMICPFYLADVEPFTKAFPGKALDPDAWAPPANIDEKKKVKKHPRKDPREKSGIVGAFNRAYNVRNAIASFLPDIFIPDGERYRYMDTHSGPGVVVYPSDDGTPDQYLYSFHSNEDPYSGRLMDAFTLIQMHLYGHLDKESKEGTPPSKLPSYAAMQRLASEDPNIEWGPLSYSAQVKTGPSSKISTDPESWMSTLILKNNTDRALVSEPQNLVLILQNDSNLRDAFMLNTMNNEVWIKKAIPGAPELVQEGSQRTQYPVPLTNSDIVSVMSYISQYYTTGKIGIHEMFNYIQHAASFYPFNPVVEYLRSLPQWDGEPRIDTLFCQTVHAQDTVLTREVSRLFFVGAVMRALKPGSKLDNVLILQGPEGIGKSSIFHDLGGALYSEVSDDIRDHDTIRVMQRNWIVEMSELVPILQRGNPAQVKAIISRIDDEFRPKYGITPVRIHRSFVCVGTTNAPVFLRDNTGNRRFWIIQCADGEHYRENPLPQETIDQVWAEALATYELENYNTTFTLTPEAQSMLLELQEVSLQTHTLEEEIREYLTEGVPVNWEKRTMEEWIKYRLDRPKEQTFAYLESLYGKGVNLRDKKDIRALMDPWGTYHNDYTTYCEEAPEDADKKLYPRRRVDVQELVYVLHHERERDITLTIRAIMDRICSETGSEWIKNPRKQRHGLQDQHHGSG